MTTRPLPSIFAEHRTHDDMHPNRGRPPVIDRNMKGTLSEILVGPNKDPTRLCLATLPHAVSSEEIARLVIGAMLECSGTTPVAARVLSIANREWHGRFESWAKRSVDQGGANPFPTTAFPAWYRSIDVDSEDFRPVVDVNPIELAAYAGVLALAIAKEPTWSNLGSFNHQCREAVVEHMGRGPLKIFTDDSPYLTLEVLLRVHRTFNSHMLDRVCVLSAIVDHNGPALSDASARAFYAIFERCAGVSMTSLLILIKFTRAYPRLCLGFPELTSEFNAASRSLEWFREVPEKRRLFTKAIFGSSYVPVGFAGAAELLGVAVFALQQSDPCFAGYAGARLSNAMREKLIRLFKDTPDIEARNSQQK